MIPLSIDVWSDLACPWCFIGKRRLAAALRLRASTGAPDVEVVYHAFQLDPAAPKSYPPAPSYLERLAQKYRTSVQQAETMVRRVTETGQREGIDFQFDRVQGCNTFDAHRLLHLGRHHGVQAPLKERLFRATFSEGRLLSDPGTLTSLGAGVGLDVDEITGMLHGDTYAAEVQEDLAAAARLGIHGVPFFVIDGRYAVEGAQPAPFIAQVLAKADAAQSERGASEASGESCGTDGCV